LRELGGSTTGARALPLAAAGVAAACAHLHGKAFTHGDLYAHNTLVETASGEAKVGDFGAAYRYAALGAEAAPYLERLEVRAFGCMAEELLERLAPPITEAEPLAEALTPLVGRCMVPDVLARPSFAQVVEELARLPTASKL
jgi:hypothetical protein